MKAVTSGREWRNEVLATLTVSQRHSSSLPEEHTISTRYFDPQLFPVLCRPNGANCKDVSWPPPANSCHRVISLSCASAVVIKVKSQAEQLLGFIRYQPQAHLDQPAGRASWPMTSPRACGISVLGDPASSATTWEGRRELPKLHSQGGLC